MFLLRVLEITQGSWSGKEFCDSLIKGLIFFMAFFFKIFQIIIFLPFPPEQTRSIWGLILAEFTQFVYPIKEFLNFKVSISQNLIILSILALKIDLLSVEKSKDKTGAE